MPQSKSPLHDPNFNTINDKKYLGNVQRIKTVLEIQFFFQLKFK